jgi:hypothetical protein
VSDRIVEVEWEDSNACHAWQSVEDMPVLLAIHSVGIVVRDDDEGILIAESWVLPPLPVGQKPYGCSTIIPRSAIRKVSELKYHRKRR